jgi:hypothetical protein
MNIFKTKTSWTNGELGVLKVCAGSFYLLVGLYFHEFLINYIWIFRVIFAISVIWILLIWNKKEKIRS